MTRLRAAVYNLKRRFKERADIYHVVSATGNSQTGRISLSRTKYSNKSIVLLPNTINRDPGQSYGMQRSMEQDLMSSQILIEKSQLPVDFLFGEKDYLITHSIIQRKLRQRRRYNIEKIEEIDISSWLLTVKNIKGAEFNEIFDLSISESVTINHTSATAPNNEQSYLFPIELPMTLNW